MRIEFQKMHGLGNDFIVFDAPPAPAAGDLTPARFTALADRHTGIGFDQALMLEPPRAQGSRAYYRIFNADGSEVEQCGNGVRCVAALLYARDPSAGREFLLDSPGGRIGARVREDGLVSVDMGVPNFVPDSLPFTASGESHVYALNVNGREIDIGAVSMGNPHAVLQVPDIDAAPVERLGPAIEHHARFPKRTNVGFMQIVDRGHIRLRVYERGAGETRACGTGACAAVAVGRRHGLLDEKVEVSLKGGKVMVSWAGGAAHLWLTGPVARVFSGTIEI
ncbi:MAG: diaminopimelate epimerase [Proteobacteria bacterium]|nr:diaminopimelate epimerase [Pseudomonadota bacterium]